MCGYVRFVHHFPAAFWLSTLRTLIRVCLCSCSMWFVALHARTSVLLCSFTVSDDIQRHHAFNSVPRSLSVLAWSAMRWPATQQQCYMSAEISSLASSDISSGVQHSAQDMITWVHHSLRPLSCRHV